MEAGKVILEIKRSKEGVMSLSIKVPEELEKFFKDRVEGRTERSNLWFEDREKNTGAKYYQRGDWTDIQAVLGDRYTNNAGGRFVTRGTPMCITLSRVNIGASNSGFMSSALPYVSHRANSPKRNCKNSAIFSLRCLQVENTRNSKVPCG